MESLAKEIYTVYKTTNNINGRIYIGVHRTKVPLDKYLGSGLALKAAIEKYGVENFSKSILKIFETKKEAYNYEREIVDVDFVNSHNTYNMREGGCGGRRAYYPTGPDHPLYGIKYSEERKAKMRQIRGEAHCWFGRKHTEETKAKMAAASRGVKKSKEARAKMSAAHKEKKISKEQIEKTKITVMKNGGHALTGVNGPDHPSYGRRTTPEHRIGMSKIKGFLGYYIVPKISEPLASQDEVCGRIGISHGSVTNIFNELDRVISPWSYWQMKYLHTLGSKNDVVGKTFREIGFSLGEESI